MSTGIAIRKGTQLELLEAIQYLYYGTVTGQQYFLYLLNQCGIPVPVITLTGTEYGGVAVLTVTQYEFVYPYCTTGRMTITVLVQYK